MQLVRANYAGQRRNTAGQLELRYFTKALSARTGINLSTLANMIHSGRQPSPQNAIAIARGLGLHPFSVLYRAALINDDDLDALLGSGHLPSPEDLRATLASLDALPTGPEFDAFRTSVRTQTEQMLAYVEELHHLAGLSPEEFGAAQAEIVRREIVADQAPLPLPAPPGDEYRASLAPHSDQNQQAGQAGPFQTPPGGPSGGPPGGPPPSAQPRRRPGPTRRRSETEPDEETDGDGTPDGK